MVNRVLFFRPTLGDGGADRVTWTLLRHLDRAAFSPSIALMRAEGPFIADLPADVDVHVLGTRRLALSIPALTRLIRKTKPDVLFSTASAANIICVAAHRAASSSARLVLSERNALFRGRSADAKQRIEVALKRLTYRAADVVTAVSQGVADQLVEAIGVPRSRIRVVYNPMVDADLAIYADESVEHPWFAEAAPIVTACARLVAQKDYSTLLKAFSRLRAQIVARLFILGEGPMREQLQAEARSLGIADEVCFHGFDRNPFKYFARSRLLMHASRAEGLPGALIQSMACGAPVVSTDCDFGPREVVSHGVNGYLAPVGDQNALARHALALLSDDPLRERMSTAARVSADRFTLASSLARYQAALEGR